jgi:Helix-turn-helix domain of transposase family ISL3/zinc-finger of transposase IS204/IS1001/IS1096/IS1165
MRVTTAFNRVLALPGAWVATVSFTSCGIVVGLRRRGRWLCCPCGHRTRSRYDTSRRRWRHLDFGACKVWLEADLHRVDCPACRRVRTEQVPWARPGARHTRDFEDLVAWLAQRMDKTSVARLLRCSRPGWTAAYGTARARPKVRWLPTHLVLQAQGGCAVILWGERRASSGHESESTPDPSRLTISGIGKAPGSRTSPRRTSERSSGTDRHPF